MNKEKLLVLDDEPQILSSMEDLFEDDYEVLTTTNAEEALRLAQEHDVVAVLTDERMPGLSGHEFLQRVKEVSKATRMMISGYADLEALTRAVNLGQIFAYVAKPWDPKELKVTVSAAMVHFRLNQAIAHERELLRVLMESIPDLIYFKDSDSRFTRINQEYARALGARDPQECVGKRDLDFFEPEYARRSFDDEQEIVRSGQPLLDRVEKLTKADGKFRWMSTTKVPILGKSGLVSGIVGVSRDITSLKKIEEELREKSESAESASRAKSEFLAVMSHEIRTPMNAILGMADLLSKTALSTEQQDYVRIFQRGGVKLLDLINNILDLSKVESGRFELDSIDFDLGVLLVNTIEIMFSRAQASGLRVTCQVLPDVPLQLAGDPGRLRQILINLIGNALKFTEQGSVGLRVEWVPADGEAGSLRFSVTDTGIGIAPEKMEMIFASFTQADSSTTRRYGGTGLGLAICKSLVERMGGQIGCTSEVGKGSTFFFTVPLGLSLKRQLPKTIGRGETGTSPVVPDSLAIPIPRAGIAGQQPATRILIVEDCEDNVFVVKAYLNDSGFDLDVAPNGEIAVAKVMSGKYDLVLMDVQMPVMDGHAATRAIRQWEGQQRLHPVPILALTAGALKGDIEKSNRAGCTAYLSKPISQATLLKAISRHIGGSIPLGPPEDIPIRPQGIIAFIPQYLEHVRQGMSDILAGLELSDYEIARRLGHQLKGSGGSFGFPEISRAGAVVESAAKEANEDAIRTQLLALASYVERIEIEVQAE